MPGDELGGIADAPCLDMLQRKLDRLMAGAEDAQYDGLFEIAGALRAYRLTKAAAETVAREWYARGRADLAAELAAEGSLPAPPLLKLVSGG